MAAHPSPNPDRSEQIASTYQFRAFTDRQDTDEIPMARKKNTGVVVIAAVLAAALVLSVVAVLVSTL